RHQASIRPLAGPVSKPITSPSRGSRVRLAMPPRLSTARSSSARSTAAWKAGISGAPWPPAATSRRRKSATTHRPVASAITFGSPICRVKGASPRGSWRRVTPSTLVPEISPRKQPSGASLAGPAMASAGSELLAAELLQPGDGGRGGGTEGDHLAAVQRLGLGEGDRQRVAVHALDAEFVVQV